MPVTHMRKKRPVSDIGTKRVLKTYCGLPVHELSGSSHSCFKEDVNCAECLNLLGGVRGTSNGRNI